MISIGIADDDALVRQTLSDLLSKNDDIVVTWTAKDGQEALDLFRSSEVDNEVQAILVDVQMPKMDGLALAKALLEENPEIAILILTTFTADSIVDDAMALGVRGFVAKEDGASSLAGAIRQAVAGNLVLSPTSSAIISDQARLWANGSAQPSESTSKQTQTRQSTSPLPHGITLSEREREVLKLVVDAKTNKQIATRLRLSEATIKTHVSAIIAKLGVQDRVGAVVYALQHNLI
jgi:two component luxR family transcriptional regulator